MPANDQRRSGGSGYRTALVAIALFAGFAGIVSTTGLVLAGQYVQLIVPVSLLSALAFVLTGFLIAGRLGGVASRQF